jgi:hypothetical protein
MTWAKLDDRFPEHPKVASLTDGAFRLHVTALCYVARNLTDGEISPAVLRLLRGSPRRAAELVAAGVWDATESAWAIHDYLDYNPSREEVNGKREHINKERSKAGSKGAAKRWQRDS